MGVCRGGAWRMGVVVAWVVVVVRADPPSQTLTTRSCHGTAAVKMFHILETRPTKVRWCWLVRERGTTTATPLVSTVLVLRVAILGGGYHNLARCGIPYTCALWNTTSAATSLRCSSESRGLTGSSWAGVSAASTNCRARRWMQSSLLVCEAPHDIQDRAAYSN
ncbi:hypothetical protein GWK47_014702 [Chionoecetes opilio]|uniref:Secreted protein n=1 Tax=Chionoecetes opilio TaxID=41210 RepID=A0A8J5CKE9_CHIOP|nr:hypothetical protein GWK47_014702 [Chionoecetes opilio]